MVDAISQVTVGVADLKPVFDLWIDRFGLETVVRRTGPDPGLARLWGIEATNIADQLLIRTPGAETGWLHFVQFDKPDVPARRGAAATDLGPKNIDVNCRDMPVRHAELRAAGHSFRSPIVEYELDGIRAREVQMPGHDDINVVLIEVLSKGFEINFSPRSYGAVTSFVVIVPDTIIEAEFFHRIFGFDELMHHRITGPGIEEAVGLPKGTVLDMRLMGREGKFFGRAELIAYEGFDGVDRFALAKAPSLGTLHCGIAVDSVLEIAQRARDSGIAITEFSDIDTIFGAGHMAALYTPAGLRIDVYETSEIVR